MKVRNNNKSKKAVLAVVLVLFIFLTMRMGFSQDGIVADTASSGTESQETSSSESSSATDTSSNQENTGNSEDTGDTGDTGEAGDSQENTDEQNNENSNGENAGDSEDTGDTGNTEDTGDTGDDQENTGDTGDTEDTGDTGDNTGENEETYPNNQNPGNETQEPEENTNNTDENTDEDTDDNEDEPVINLCANKDCWDNNECTRDYCEDGRCYNTPITGCKINQSQDANNEYLQYLYGRTIINPEDLRYVLLNELPGMSFSIDTSKKQYTAQEDVWLKINAPEQSDVELSFVYDGFQHYIKIPKDKGYPLNYPLPLPRNIKDGIYVIRAATYYMGLILKTDTHFKIGNVGNEDLALDSIEQGLDEEGNGETKYEGTYEKPEDQAYETANEQSEESALDDSAAQLNTAQEQEAYAAAQGNESLLGENQTQNPFAEIAEEGIAEHEPIKVGEPVKWSKSVNIENHDYETADVELLVNIPEKISNVDVAESDSGNQASVEMDGADLVITDKVEGMGQEQYIISFETEAPQKTEEIVVENDDEWKKEVVVSSGEEYSGEYEYREVFAYTDIMETEKENIHLYWNMDGESIDVTYQDSFNVRFYDTNNNGLIDEISWITPHLSTQEFEIVITLTPSTGTGLSIDLIRPNGDIYKEGTEIDFRFIVSYNKSLDVWCSLKVDDGVKEDMAVLDGQETIASRNISLSQGRHNWSVSCNDELNNTRKSSTNFFVIDTEPPRVELKSSDPILSLTDCISLNFTAVDNLASYLVCSLTANNDVKESGMSVENNIVKTVTLSNLENGTYKWSVTCFDAAGNSNTSSTKTFYIDTKRNFSIILNKETLTLGEGGVYWITSPYGSEVTLLVTTPRSTTITRKYSGPFPVVDNIDFAYYPGTYTMEGILNYNGAIKTITASFSVTNTLSASITIENSKIIKGGSIKFTAYSLGGIGDISYTWDFGDSSDSVTGKSVSHSYAELGIYNTVLTATDSKGNQITQTVTVYVEDKYPVDIIVTEAGTNIPLEGVRVLLEGEEKKTDSSGKVSYSVFKGDYRIFAKKDAYASYFETKYVGEGATISIQLEKASGTGGENATPSEISAQQTQSPSESPLQAEQGATESNNGNAEIGNEVIGTSPEVESLVSIIDTALQDMEYTNSDNKEAVLALDIRGNLENAKLNLRRAERDRYNLEENRRGLSAQEISKTLSEINNDINRIRTSTIKTLDVMERDEFVKYPTNDEVKDVSLEFLKSSNTTLDSKKTEYFIKSNQEMQSLITVSTKIKKATIQYLSGNKQEILLIINSINSDSNLTDESFVVVIPKEIAKSTDEIEIVTPHTVINPDPVIKFDLEKTKQVVYYLKGDIDLEKAKSIKTVLVYSPEKIEYIKSSLGIVGLAIFSKIRDIVEVDNPIVILEVVLIVVLLTAYLAYQFDFTDRIKKGMVLGDNELKDINGMIEDANTCLKNKETENASVVYSDMMKAYKNLSAKSRSKIYNRIINLYNDIMVSQINNSVNMTFAHVKENNIQQAKSNYEVIKKLYQQLPKEQKAKVAGKCSQVFEMLSNVK